MAIIRSDRYPGRYDPADALNTTGAFKNRTTTTSKDGSYLERDWLNDWAAVFNSILNEAGVIPNGIVDTVGASQYYDALIDVIRLRVGEFASAENRHKGNQNWNVAGSTGDPLPSASPTLYTVGAEIAAGRFCVGSNLVNCTYDGGLFNADSGSYYVEYNGDFTGDWYGLELADGTVTQDGCTLAFVGGATRLTVDMTVAPAHKFPGQSSAVGFWGDVSDDESRSTLYNERQSTCGWVDVTADRAIGVPEINNTGTWIYANFEAVSTDLLRLSVSVDGVGVSGPETVSGIGNASPVVKVPPGSTYAFVLAGIGTTTPIRFREWRPL